MTMTRAIAVAGLVIAVAGCGDDGNDATGGWASGDLLRSAPAAEADAPQIRVVEMSGAAEDGEHGDHGDEATDMAHDESSDGETDGMSEPADDGAAHGEDGSAHGETEPAHAAAEPAHAAAEPDHGEDGPDHAAAEPEHGAAEPGHGADSVEGDTGHDDGGHVVEVAMVEFGYVLDHDTVPVGEPVTFRFVNEGQIEHEAMFGTLHQQEEFAASDGHGDHGSEGHHGEIAAITLDAAASGEMVMVFDSPGEVLIGCHLPGHWEAGMVASLEVVAA